VKGYRLWCTDSKSHGFVTSKDVTFDTAGSVEESSKQVELENKASERVHNGTRVGPVDVAQGSTFNDGNPPLQQYNITTRREEKYMASSAICPCKYSRNFFEYHSD